MRCLVVHAHPNPESFSRALRDRAVGGLERGGHEVDVLDLYQVDYDPNLSADEHRRYETIGHDHPDPRVAAHIKLLRAAHALVFVYPTWWSGLPAILDGWLQRTLLPGVAFSLGSPSSDRSLLPGLGRLTRTGAKVVATPQLDNITRLVGVTTYGSGPLEVRLLGDGGRRTVTRTVRLVCARRCRTTWLSLNRLDTASDEARDRFLDRVGDAMEQL